VLGRGTGGCSGECPFQAGEWEDGARGFGLRSSCGGKINSNVDKVFRGGG
jgi:hypothetical protein